MAHPDDPTHKAVPAPMQAAWRALRAFLDRSIQFKAARVIGGGCINRCHAVESDAGTFFLKQQDHFYPGFFAAEAAALTLLQHASGAAKVPRPLLHQDDPAASWIWMEFLDSASRRADADAVLGQQLARMHAVSSEAFGRPGEDGPFYLARLEQDNRPVPQSWPEFFRRRRCQALIAACGSRLPLSLALRLEHLADALEERVPKEPPALIHGDLWSGNALIGPHGLYALVDPAPLYGHRESDLAMMRLFGGFAERTFEAYAEAYPLQPGWEERTALFQLEPLLVHVALFGGAYVQQLHAALDQLKA